MTPDASSNIWVPICCGRVMRCNMFRQPNGGAYAALVCTACNKNITLEQQSGGDTSAYGEGVNLLNLVGAPKPPKTERRRASGDNSSDEPTL
jgi:hypothetical protein